MFGASRRPDTATFPVRSPCNSGTSIPRLGMFKRARPDTSSPFQSSSTTAWLGPDRTSTPRADHRSSRRATCPFASNGASFNTPLSAVTFTSTSSPSRVRSTRPEIAPDSVSARSAGSKLSTSACRSADHSGVRVTRPLATVPPRSEVSDSRAISSASSDPAASSTTCACGRSGTLIAAAACTSNCSNVPASCALKPAMRTRSELHSASVV